MSSPIRTLARNGVLGTTDRFRSDGPPSGRSDRATIRPDIASSSCWGSEGRSPLSAFSTPAVPPRSPSTRGTLVPVAYAAVDRGTYYYYAHLPSSIRCPGRRSALKESRTHGRSPHGSRRTPAGRPRLWRTRGNRTPPAARFRAYRHYPPPRRAWSLAVRRLPVPPHLSRFNSLRTVFSTSFRLAAPTWIAATRCSRSTKNISGSDSTSP